MNLVTKTGCGVLLLLLAVSSECFAHDRAGGIPQPEQDRVREAAVEALERAALELSSGISTDTIGQLGLVQDLIESLAPHNPERCKQLLDALFEEALANTTGTSNASISQNPGEVVGRIAKIAGRFDWKLARSYLDRYREKSRTGPLPATPQVIDLYLKLSNERISTDPESAVQLAAEALSSELTPSGLVFLNNLRSKAPDEASRAFGIALEGLSSRRTVGIGELLLLYAYAFSSQQVPMLSEGRLSRLYIPQYEAVPDRVDPRTARSFLEFVVNVLTDSSRYLQGKTVPGLPEADLYLLRILQQRASAYAPELSAQMATQEALVRQSIGRERQAAIDNETGRFIRREAEERPSAEGTRPQIEPAADTHAQDRFHFGAADGAARRGDYDAALRETNQISSTIRDAAREFVKFVIAEREAGQGRWESAERWAREDPDSVRKAYLLTLVAQARLQRTRKDADSARALVMDIGRIAEGIKPSQEQIAVLVGGAFVLAKLDQERAFDVLLQVVSRANEVDAFTGETAVDRFLDIGGFSFHYPLYANRFTFGQLIAELAKIDFYRTLELTRGLKNTGARLFGTISGSRAVLSRPSRGMN